MKFLLDVDTGIAYMTMRLSQHVTCLEGAGPVLIRIDPVAREVVGFAILDYMLISNHGSLTFPFVDDPKIVDALRRVLWNAFYELEGGLEFEVDCDIAVPFTDRMAEALWPDGGKPSA